MRVLAAATDPGGIRNVQPVIGALESEGCQVTTCFGPETDPGGLQGPGADLGSLAVRLMDSVQPDALLVGTTGTPSLERELTAEAGRRGIWSVAVLDEWYNYAMRFEAAEGELTYLPDLVAAMDEMAVEEAVQEGIPPDRLVVTGSVALSERWGEIQLARALPKVPSGKILFVSEEIARDESWSGVGGYTERDALDVVCRTITTDYTIREKLHPSSSRQEGRRVHATGTQIDTVKGTSITDELLSAELCIGIKSMALLEAALSGTPTISVQPVRSDPEQCTAARLDLINVVSTSSELARWISSPSLRGFPTPTQPQFIEARAAQNVAALVTDRSR